MLGLRRGWMPDNADSKRSKRGDASNFPGVALFRYLRLGIIGPCEFHLWCVRWGNDAVWAALDEGSAQKPSPRRFEPYRLASWQVRKEQHYSERSSISPAAESIGPLIP